MEKEGLYLTEKTLITIKNEIQTELLKRGLLPKLLNLRNILEIICIK